MKCVCLVVAVLSLLAATASTPAHDPVIWLMFFMRGSAAAPKDEKVVATMMEGHLGNMKKQAALDRLLVAGPLQDPGKERRGITVVAAHDLDEVKSFFRDDPFVKLGSMTVAAFPWKVDRARFTSQVDPNALAPYRLVLLKRGKGMRPENDAMAREHRAALDALTESMKPGVWGEISHLDKVREVAIVTGDDTQKVLDAFANDPLVKAAILEVEVIPLWMSKGVILPKT